METIEEVPHIKPKGKMTDEQYAKHLEKVRIYNKNQPRITCDICKGHYQPVNKHTHIKSRKHIEAFETQFHSDKNMILIKKLEKKIEDLEMIVSHFAQMKDLENIQDLQVYSDDETEKNFEYDDEEEEDDTSSVAFSDMQSIIGSELGKWEGSELNYII